MKMKRSISGFLVLGTVVASMVGCRPEKGVQSKGKTKKPQRVETAVVVREQLVERLQTTGDVVATNAVILRATVEGPISFCPWREGDVVEEAGQKLVEIDRPLYRQEVAAAAAAEAVARAKLADLKAGPRPEEIAQARESVRHLQDCTQFAQADLERIRSLVKSGTLPAETEEKARVSFIKCQTQCRAAKEQLAMLEAGPTKTALAVQQAAVGEATARRGLAQAKLDECLLKAPFAGVITQVFVRPGDLATPRVELLKMMDASSLVVRAGLPEACAAGLRKGTEAVVRLDAYPQQTFKGRIERIYPRLEQNSRTRMVEVKILDSVKLLPRMFARISVRGQVFDDALVVPSSAIVATPRGDKIVYVVEEGKAVLKKVEIGLEEGSRVQIVAGLEEGEKLVVAGNLNLKNGAVVTSGKKEASAEAVWGKDK